MRPVHTGDFDGDTFHRPKYRALLAAFIFVTAVVLLNVLIAIVSDSYNKATETAPQLFYRARLELITETGGMTKYVPAWLKPTQNVASIKKRLHDVLKESRDSFEDPGRIGYAIQHVKAIVKDSTQRTVADASEREARLEKRMADMEQTLAKIVGLLENQ